MNYLVRPDGNDSNDGVTKPWGTLASIRRCRVGDVVSLKGEFKGSLVVPNGVTVNGPASIFANSDWAVQVRNCGNGVVLRRIHAILESPPESPFGCAIISASNFVRLTDCWFHASGHWDREVVLLYGSNNCAVNNCTVTIPESSVLKELRGKRGICIRGQNNVINHCSIRVPSLAPQGSWNGTSGVTVYAGVGPNGEVECIGNEILDTSVLGCSYYGVGFYQNSHRNLAKYCRVMGSGYGFMNSLTVDGTNKAQSCWIQTPQLVLQAEKGHLDVIP